jgi:hypothetical protein
MREIRKIFLSASVPLPSRDAVYFRTADIIAIRDAVRALTMVVIEEELELVFGGHPAIMPMIRLQIAQTGSPVGKFVLMYRSRFFENVFPADDIAFERVLAVDAVPNDRAASLQSMRQAMLMDPILAGVFVGGMEGVEEEYSLLRQVQPDAPAYPIASTGAAAARLYDADPTLQRLHPELRDEISYLSLMRSLIGAARADSGT